MKKPSRVAIVGRPNVGKSTLFNRITRKRRALVHSSPGVTRDVQRHEAEWCGVAFELVDTGGLFSGIDDELIHEVEERAFREAVGADAMIFVTDAEAGITSADIEIANRIREFNVPVFLAANKSESATRRLSGSEFYRLGYDTIHSVSAIHGDGVGDLLDAVVSVLPAASIEEASGDLKVALVGRPNVGKSSLTNALLGDDVAIVDSRPGTTRDSVDVSVRWHSRQLTLVDTAGIRKRSKSRDGLTSLTAIKSIDAISRADVVILVLDATREIGNQDVKVASYAHKAAKGLLICVNKWDTLEKDNSSAPDFEKKIRRAFRYASYAPIIFTSAVTHQRVSKLFDMAWAIHESREVRLSTSEVNRFVEEVVGKNPPSYYGGGTGKVYYMTQVGVSPPTFACFVNRRAFFGRPYLRFLNNQLRERYPFEGTLIRIKLIEKDSTKGTR